MRVINGTIGKTDKEVQNLLDFLSINYPGYRFITEGQYSIHKDGVKYVADTDKVYEGKTVRLEIGNEGLTLELPIETLKKPNISVIPVYLSEDKMVDLNCVFDSYKSRKVDYASNAEKVHSFENWEMRNGQIYIRNKKMINNDNIIIIEA